MAALSSITTALERCWTAIRTVYPDTREAALVVYLHPQGDRKGHYWQSSWQVIKDNTALDEVHISSHLFALDGLAVFETLLHEACHSIATTRKVQDTSRQGRWHNAKFVEIAEQVGLVCESNPQIGTVTTGITEKTQKQFKNAIDMLSQAIEMFQAMPTKKGKGKGKGKGGMLKLVCPGCGRVIRASQKTIEQGPIVCGPCVSIFEQEQS